MAWRKGSSYGQQETMDGSLGLVMRLAVLWQKVDTVATEGNFERWNTYLDRIFCNLLYREELQVDEETKEATLSEKDRDLWRKLNAKVILSNKKLSEAHTKKDYLKAKDELYKSLLMKDVGLRKFHHNTLGTYTKEVTKNPARSMWGG